MIDYLTLEDVVILANELAGGRAEVRDLGLLDAAVHRPRASLFGADAYPELHGKAAALLHSLARNHALVDGNKRLAWTATTVFYRLNGYALRAPFDDAFSFVLAVAEGKTDVPHMAEQLAAWAVSTER